ncbi:restriction endonuclease subunit S [Galactobacillus timonensis]|uniref:restriction endonuclease subunit S n=1 Tax=Galactobacillus timonensis TaxID=2041840 RepID=UPI000C8660B6|nr:restriction endonuclease subunit S [Galactobacillus timonensis]
MNKVLLGDVAEEVRENYKETNGNPAVVGLEHLIPGEIRLKDWSEDINTTFTKTFHKGQVLFGRRRAYLKKAAVAPVDGICSGDITVISAKPDKILPELLPFVIQNDDFFDFAVGKSAGSLSPRVKWSRLKEYEFNLPSLPQQRKLAKLLWSFVDAKEAYEDLIRQTDELVKSQFIEMFGDPLSDYYEDESAVLSAVFEKPQSGEWGNDDIDGNGVSVLRTTNFTDDGYITYEDVATRDIDRDKAKDKFLQPGDILIEKSGGSGDKPVGRVVLYEREPNKYLNNNFTARLHLNGKYNLSRLYTFYFMFVNYKRGGTKLFEGKTTGIHNLRLDEYLKNTSIPIPSAEKQNRFVNLAQQSDKSKFILQPMPKKLLTS